MNNNGAIWQEVQAPKWQPARTAWLVTIVDLTALILGFFVLMFSLQTLDRDSWEAVAGSFQSTFSTKDAVVPVTPQGLNNALVVTTGVKSNLSYLDSLLNQQLGKDPVWGQLKAQTQGAGAALEMFYVLPKSVTDPALVGSMTDWRKLGDVVRGWKNPMFVRVIVTEEQWKKGAEQALGLAAMLAHVGVVGIVGEVRSGPEAQVQLVVSVR